MADEQQGRRCMRGGFQRVQRPAHLGPRPRHDAHGASIHSEIDQPVGGAGHAAGVSPLDWAAATRIRSRTERAGFREGAIGFGGDAEVVRSGATRSGSFDCSGRKRQWMIPRPTFKRIPATRSPFN